MKAIILKEPGGVDQLELAGLEIPTPAKNEVLVKVYAIGINPVDIKTRKGGALYGSLKEDPPIVLGWDISGVVLAAGSEVKKFREGDAVFGMVNFPGHGKAYAEYVAAPADHLAIKPLNCTHAEAAATTLAALTAWQVLVHQARLQPGQHLLMHAAAGGVGHFAVQIAKHLGAKITGTASAANEGFLKELGVDHFIDYRSSPAYAGLEVDLVFDPIGGDTTFSSLQAIRHGGKLVSIVGGVKEDVLRSAAERDIEAKNYLVQSSGADMEALAGLLEQGQLEPHISKKFSLDNIAEAHQQIETGRTKGKIVLTLDDGRDA
ncbi:MAG TPA: NADP-dependent oxidoreductase [Flavisolibacter sp.]|nr:NADP-dependent oxidoreductase [Flavisolibacter sp.]